MGWFEVIMTGLSAANTAANIHSARTISKIQQQAERAEQAAYETAEMLDLVDRVNRRMRKNHQFLLNHPQAAIVISEIFKESLKARGVVPSRLTPDQRPRLRDLNDKFDEYIEDATKCLSQSEVEQAYHTVSVINNMPALESSIRAKESLDATSAAAVQAEQYMRATDAEWKTLSKPAENAKVLRLIGILILVFLALTACFVLPLLLSIPLAGLQALTTDFMSGMVTLVIGIVLNLGYLGVLVGSVMMIVKGNAANNPRYKELEAGRNNAIRALEASKKSVSMDPAYAGFSLQELYEQQQRMNQEVAVVMGEMTVFKKLFLLED